MTDEQLLEEENRSLKLRIQQLEAKLAESQQPNDAAHTPPTSPLIDKNQPHLHPEEYRRYGRQMIMREIGLHGQLRLKKSKVLIVGAGGLGCPAAAYLAGAGVGTLGIIDHDTVETSNLHRQILHATSRVGVSKVESAIHCLKDLNPHPTYIPHAYALTPTNSLDLIQQYDLILDCTDHPSLRYLISDAAVIAGKPIVSASALRSEGQLIVLNSPPGKGPCYRCIWPRPPPAESVVGCGEGGILGPVVGLMGVMQALEAVKVITNPPQELEQTRMMFFSAFLETMVRSVRMRGRRKTCVACGEPENPDDRITRERILDGGMDYVAFCGGLTADVKLLEPKYRVGVEEVRTRLMEGRDALLVDVRDATQFGICSVPGSVNVPFDMFTGEGLPEAMREELGKVPEEAPVYLLCRLGNDSQVATRRVLDSGRERVWDVRGGVKEWARAAPEDGVVEY